MKQPNTKQQILLSALNHFSTYGYTGASIRQIAREVGIRESAIYNHYKSKEEIFNAILNKFKSRSISNKVLSDELLDQLTNPGLFLRNFSKKLVEYWNSEEERKFIRLLLMEQFTKIGNVELSITDYLGELRNICKLIFTEMIKLRIIKNFDPEILSEQFSSPLFLIRIENLVGNKPANLNEVNKLVIKHVDFFWSAIRTDN